MTDVRLTVGWPMGNRLDATRKHAAPTRYSAESISLRKLIRKLLSGARDTVGAQRGIGFDRRACRLRHLGISQKPINFGKLGFGSLYRLGSGINPLSPILLAEAGASRL